MTREEMSGVEKRGEERRGEKDLSDLWYVVLYSLAVRICQQTNHYISVSIWETLSAHEQKLLEGGDEKAG